LQGSKIVNQVGWDQAKFVAVAIAFFLVVALGWIAGLWWDDDDDEGPPPGYSG
jgi:hypothetical protein